MPANSVLVTIILTCFLWGSPHHPPFWALLCYSLCLPHSLIFSLHVFTVSLPLAVKSSVSPIFAFLLLTDDDLVVKSSGRALSSPFWTSLLCAAYLINSLLLSSASGMVHASGFPAVSLFCILFVGFSSVTHTLLLAFSSGSTAQLL